MGAALGVVALHGTKWDERPDLRGPSNLGS